MFPNVIRASVKRRPWISTRHNTTHVPPNSFKTWGVQDGVNIYQTHNQPITFDPTPTTRREDLQKLEDRGFLIHNVLTPSECEQFINLTEEMGYTLAKVTTKRGMIEMKNIRDNKRVLWQLEGESTKITDILWDRISDHIQPPFTEARNSVWVPLELSQRLRFYKYEPGQVFVPHFDGFYRPNSLKMTLMSLLIYLNDNKTGGETTFYVPKKDGTEEKVKVFPQQGTALLFWHGQHQLSTKHEGSECLEGLKYVLRSDVIFYDSMPASHY